MNMPEPLQRRDISTSTEDEEVEPTDYRASSRNRLPPLNERKEDDGKGDINQRRPPVVLIENQVSFEHQQYEQWARLPVRRPLVPLQNKIVQQPKPRPLTRSDKSDTSDTQVTKARPNVVREKSVLSRLTTCLNLKREKTILTERSFSKEKIFHKFKNPLSLANATFLDLSDEEMVSFKSQREIKGTAEYQDNREFHQETRLTMSRAKLRDRCPMPVSLSSPRCVGEHVFLINEPCRFSDVPKLKKKKTNQISDLSFSREMDSNSKSDRENALLHLPRSKTHYAGLLPRKLPISRSAVKMSSAEVFDFSKIEQFSSSPGALQKASDDRLAHKENRDFALSMKGSHVVLCKSLLPIIKDSGG
ncbi:hypothetical protein ACJMK2_011413 [Sinanodonta woodiana]|uniref:Uncharacterized protein n=1 Tax=Sinanodonta woodiana TaxID=1069815 RepID=A0ABD3V7D3_SINWO